MRARGRQELRQPSYLRPYRMCRVCRTSDGDWTRSVSFDGSRGIGKSRISKGREDDRRATRQITNCEREEEEGRKEAKERKTHRERERERGNRNKAWPCVREELAAGAATEAERERWSERAIIEDLNGWAGSR